MRSVFPLQLIQKAFHEGLHYILVLKAVFFRKKLQQVERNIDIVLFRVRSNHPAKSERLDPDFKGIRVFIPVAEHLSKPPFGQEIGDGSNRGACSECNEQEKRYSNERRCIFRNMIDIRPAACVATDQDYLIIIDRHVNAEGDDAYKPVPECKDMPCLHLQEKCQDQERAENVGEEVRTSEGILRFDPAHKGKDEYHRNGDAGR